MQTSRRSFLRHIAAFLGALTLALKGQSSPQVTYIELTAQAHAGKVRVWLDGVETTHMAFYARVPAAPGVVADGEVHQYVAPIHRNPFTREVEKECLYGQVYWLPMEKSA